MIIDAIIRREPLPPRAVARSIHRDLETICLKALAKSPDARYATAEEMAKDLRRFLLGDHVLARRAGPVRKSWTFLRRRRALVSAVLFAVAALISLAAFVYVSGRNRELLGIKTVTLATDPPGAEVVFVPLDENSKRPVASKATFAGKSPVRIDLPAGFYQVVAVVRDESIPRRQWRFHEVWRTVPTKLDAVRAPFNHCFWEANEAGDVSLPAISIPSLDVKSGMVLVEQKPRRALDEQTAFYMDATEFTQDAYRKLHDGHVRESNGKSLYKHAAFDQAAMLLEWAGKRLPTLDEYNEAIRVSDQYSPDSPTESLKSSRIADATDTSGNATDPTRFLLGLKTDPPEWTSTWAHPGSTHGDLSNVDDIAPIKRFRMVWTGAADTDAAEIRASDGRDVQRAEARSSGSTTIGFRGVRSAVPPYIH